MKKLLAFLIIASFIGIGSCKKKDKDPDYCTGAWTTQMTDEVNAIYTALMAYSANPTTTTCNSYKNAVQAYINALRPFENCTLWTAQEKTAFQNALDDAEHDLSTACQ